MKRMFFAAMALVALATACQKDNENNNDVIYESNAQPLGNGNIRSVLKVNRQQVPQALAITFTKESMSGLPMHSGEEDHGHGLSLVLPIPGAAGITPFDHIGVDWNPHGHEPEVIYGLPHFDFHFYMMPLAERLTIPPFEVDPTGFLNFPAPAYLPANYFNGGGGVPQMGAHWVDLTSPELDPNNPAVFTQTFIYGSYAGKVNFLEPMITRQFLLDAKNFERNIPQPSKVDKTGYYPTKMQIFENGQTISVILKSFIYLQAS